MFSIEIDRRRNALAVRFDGTFWSADVLEGFRHGIAQAVRDLAPAPGTHLVLVDLRNAILQSQDTIAGAQKLIGASTAARIALVASRALARMQTKRLQLRENVVLFADMAAAEAWLYDTSLHSGPITATADMQS